MTGELSTLSSYRLTKMRERVEKLEKALIEREAHLYFRGHADGRWLEGAGSQSHKKHYLTLAEKELIYVGLVRGKDIREMER